jgi:hypothetical protein
VTVWSSRSPEVAALLNPAFCGVLLYSAIDAYIGVVKRSMPFENAFLVLPLVLHAPTRAIFPKQVGSPFQSWASGNPALRVGLADRVRAAVPLTREGIMYMVNRHCVVVDNGALNVGTKKPKMTSNKIKAVDDVRAAVQAAAMLGRLLAGAGTSATIYTTLGIAP